VTSLTYNANSINFSAYGNVTTYGQGVIRRKMNGSGQFVESFPDGPSNFEIAPIRRATFGWSHAVRATTGGLEPRKMAGNLTEYVSEFEDANHPAYRIHTSTNSDDYIDPDNTKRATWRTVMASLRSGDFPAAYQTASTIGYEIIEFFDTSGTNLTYYILRESAAPNEAGYTGQAIVLFGNTFSTNPNLVLQAPHPIFDQLTLQQLALAVPQVRPRAAIIAGTHRNNSNTDSTCDGQLSAGVPYRISDVAHWPGSLYHVASEELCNLTTQTVSIQFHGFGGDEGTGAIVSSGDYTNGNLNWLMRRWRDRINAQNYTTSYLGNDRLTTSSIYGPGGASTLGGTTNAQGRFINGVSSANVCTVDATSANGRFIHIEQAIQVRNDPQHIITALAEAIPLAGISVPVPVAISSFEIE
jgi:hypothetical protein